jgi:hypothetical protein
MGFWGLLGSKRRVFRICNVVIQCPVNENVQWLNVRLEDWHALRFTSNQGYLPLYVINYGITPGHLAASACC